MASTTSNTASPSCSRSTSPSRRPRKRMSSKSGRSLSSRVRLVVDFGAAAPLARGAFALTATRLAAALARRGDAAAGGASEEEDLGNAALRRAGRADPEDVTLGSSQKLQSQRL